MGLHGRSGLPEGVAIVAQGRAAAIGRPSEDSADVTREAGGLVAAERARGPQGVDTRREEALIGVDVADPGCDPLVE
jgi:hypothetical protein